MDNKIIEIWNKHKTECSKYNQRVNKDILLKQVWEESRKELILDMEKNYFALGVPKGAIERIKKRYLENGNYN